MSLIHWWPLNGDTKDYIGGKNGTLINGGNVEGSGKIGKCYSSNNNTSATKSTDGVQVNLNLIGEVKDQYSFTCWFKVHGTQQQYQAALMSSGNWNIPDCWTVGLNQSNTAIVPLADGFNNRYMSIGFALENEKWYHLASVQDSGEHYVYLNGTLIGTATLTGLYRSSASTSCIGRDNDHSGFFPFNGDINDVRIYDHALSQAEVKEISKGLMLHYNFNQLYTTNICNWRDTSIISMGGHGGTKTYADGVLTLTARDGWQAFMWDIGEGNVGKAATLSFEYYVSEIHDGDYIYLQTHTSAWYGTLTKRIDSTVYEWTKETVTFSSAQQFVGFNVRGVDSSGDSLTIKVRNVKIALNDFDNIYSEYNEVATITDESGYGHDAVVYSGSVSSDTATGNRSCYTPRVLEANTNNDLNPTNASYIYSDVFGYNFTPDEFTIAFWWKPISWGHGNGPFGLVIGATDYLNSTIGVHDGSAKVNFADGSTNTKTACSISACGTGSWVHYVITGKPGEVKSYINGVRKTNAAIGSGLSLDPWRYLYLGACRAGGVLRDGDIYWGDVRYYSTALSENDVFELYKTKAYITDKGDIECGEFIEEADTARVMENYTLKANEFYEELYSGYDLLDYIESTGTQYIDSGYIAKTTHTIYELDMTWTGTNVSNWNSFIGFMASSTNPRMGLHNYQSVFMLGANATTLSTTAPVSGERILLKGDFKSGAQKMYKNGVQIASNTTTFDHSANTLTTFIFARNASTKNISTMRLYEAKIWEGDTLVRHMLPVKQQSTGDLGLYDIVNGVFYKNAGIGTFLNGRAITNKSASIYTDNHVSGREIIEM